MPPSMMCPRVIQVVNGFWVLKIYSFVAFENSHPMEKIERDSSCHGGITTKTQVPLSTIYAWNAPKILTDVDTNRRSFLK
jgi:hypothetical protein